jgi:3',5'-cyclic-AMP phosphodiesterase
VATGVEPLFVVGAIAGGSINRRTALAAIAGGSALVNAAPATKARFDFAHFTDCHLQPELGAVEGTRQCFDHINRMKPAFAIAGGDLVMDADLKPKTRARELYRLYMDVHKRLAMPVHAVLGNHDIVGMQASSEVAQDDPDFGKGWFEERFGRRYRSFDHQGWHFVLLDSVMVANRNFTGGIDAAQLAWLKSDLAALPPRTPVVAVTHIPLVSAALQIVPDPWKTADTYLIKNSVEVLEAFEPYNLKAVLQGHTHIRETVVHRGVQFFTSGAVCANWWKGPRIGHPEGYAMLRVRGESIEWTYQTYGWTPRSAG